jgi:DNA-binding CsgD family transcriptional regulator
VAGDVPSRDDTAGEAQDRLLNLSGAERRVCDLAGQGLTNREIAGRLFITMSTVEQHLTSIYRKLRVKGRENLPTTHGAGPSGAVLSSAASLPDRRDRPDRPLSGHTKHRYGRQSEKPGPTPAGNPEVKRPSRAP